MILRLQIPTPHRTPNTFQTVLSTTTADSGLIFRRKLLYLQSLKVNPTKALNKNPNLRSATLSTLHSTTQCLSSMGIEFSALGRILDMYPELLTSDPYSDIYPIFDFLLNTVEIPFPDIRKSIIRCPRLLVSDPESQLKPAFEFLTRFGFSGPNKITSQTTVLLVSSVEFTLIPKIDYLVGLGLEYDDVRSMVLRSPGLLTFSLENNYKPKVEFFLEEMNGSLEEIKRFPQYFSFSLERRIKPRHRVLTELGFSMPLSEMLKVSDGDILHNTLNGALLFFFFINIIIYFCSPGILSWDRSFAMGITGEIVRNVFSKSRSIQRHDSHSHQTNSNVGVEKRKWSSSVRSYLCGDEYNSVTAADDDSASFRSSAVAAEVDLASFRSNRATTNTSSCGVGEDITSVYAEEIDAASVRSSEATVDQPQFLDSKDENNRKEKRNSAHKLFQQEDAALIIQSAFRRFLMARRAREVAKNEGAVSPSRESIGTSIEVQTGNSSDIFSIKDDNTFDLHHTLRHRTRAQVLKIQEDWDDSTLSSVISKTRMQNRLEAATRRERALAYAFSQQLRICSKRKQIMGDNNDETNTGWSWLQRWMAARGPEIEEKESCGSNEVASLVENATLFLPKNIPRPPTKTRNKSTRSFSRQNSSASSHLCPRESKEMKKVCHMEDKRKRAKQPEIKKLDIKNATIETHDEQ